MKVDERKQIAGWIAGKIHPGFKGESVRVSRMKRGGDSAYIIATSELLSADYAHGYCLGVIDCDFLGRDEDEVDYNISLRWKTSGVLHEVCRVFSASLQDGAYKVTVLEKKKLYNIVLFEDLHNPNSFSMKGAQNKSGDYIGEVSAAEMLCDKMGIDPEVSKPGNSVCTIGFCIRERKWYGWSHRAIAGFGIGDMIYEESFDSPRTPPQENGTEYIRTLDDARLAAINYAEDVS